jgi:hypothetical protein
LEQVWFARHSDAKYKSKVVVDLTNLAPIPIHFSEISWLSQRGDVGVQTDFRSGYWVYPKGSSTWVDNIPDPIIEPGERFHIWVGLDQACSDGDLQNRKRAKRLGTLRVPMELDHQLTSVEYRL